MSIADKTAMTRRPFLSALVGLGALAGIVALEAPRLFPRLFARHYPPTPFDDLLALLPDRESAARIGAVLAGNFSRDDSGRIAALLRRKIGGHPLAVAIADDLAHSRLMEAQGWLLPESLADLCALATIAEHA